MEHNVYFFEKGAFIEGAPLKWSALEDDHKFEGALLEK